MVVPDDTPIWYCSSLYKKIILGGSRRDKAWDIKTMTVKLIPGPRDEEKITALRNARKTMPPEEWHEYCYNCACTHDDSWFDALYYACENGDEMLSDQEAYFQSCLINEEFTWYADRMSGNLFNDIF